MYHLTRGFFKSSTGKTNNFIIFPAFLQMYPDVKKADRRPAPGIFSFFPADTITVKMKDKDGRHMSNNMDLGYEMFCYQCEQTANGKGCTKLGVCGKTPEIANLQDLLIFQLKGISCYGKVLQDEGQHIDKNVIKFIENALFTTLTNVNFDVKVHVELLHESQRIKEELRNMTGKVKNQTSYAVYNLPETKTQMLKDAQLAGIMYDKSLDPDIRSLRQTILYGLKGISAYGHQAREL